MATVFDTYLHEPEYTFEYGTVRLEIAKAGGGTLFKEYTGDWFFNLRRTRDNKLLMSDIFKNNNHLLNHLEAAKQIAGFLSESEDVNELYHNSLSAFAMGHWG